MIKAVSFDIWYTLLDLSKFYLIVSEKISEVSGKPLNVVSDLIFKAYREALKSRLEGNFKRIIVDSAEFFASRLGISPEELFRAVVASINDSRISEMLYDDVLETLETLKSSGFKLGLLGNVMFWPGMITRYILYVNKALKFFDVTIFSDEVGLQKPSREIFEYESSKLGVKLEEMVHVGDSVENDLAGAVIAGVKAVLINRSSQTPCLRLGRNACLINTLRKLPEAIEELNKT